MYVLMKWGNSTNQGCPKINYQIETLLTRSYEPHPSASEPKNANSPNDHTAKNIQRPEAQETKFFKSVFRLLAQNYPGSYNHINSSSYLIILFCVIGEELY